MVRIITICILIQCSLASLGGTVEVESSLESEFISPGEQVQVNYTLAGPKRRIPFEPGKDFELLRGPLLSRRYEVINGKRFDGHTYTYLLSPKRNGKLIIPAWILAVGSDTFAAASHTVLVLKQAPTKGHTLQSYFNKYLGMDWNLSDKTVYEGQELVLDFNVQTAIPLRSVRLRGLPDLSEHWMQSISPDQLQKDIQSQNGRNYCLYPAGKVMIYPTDSLPTLGPLLLEVETGMKRGSSRRGRSRDPFEDFFSEDFGFFGPSYEKANFRIPKFSVQVLPLPTYGKPKNFTGAVGEFSASARLIEPDNSDRLAEQAYFIEVRLWGKGNLEWIDAPRMSEIPGMEIYPPEVVHTRSVNDKGELINTSVLKYQLIPERRGEFMLEPPSINYFDPVSEKYSSLDFDVILLAVSKVNSNPGNKVRSALEGKLHPPKSKDDTGPFESLMQNKKTMQAAAAIPILILPLLIGYKPRFIKKKKASQQVAARKNALLLAKRQISELYVGSSEEEIMRIFYEYNFSTEKRKSNEWLQGRLMPAREKLNRHLYGGEPLDVNSLKAELVALLKDLDQG